MLNVFMLFKKNVNYFKTQYRHIIFYSIPTPILFIVRKRLNMISLIVVLFIFVILTIV